MSKKIVVFGCDNSGKTTLCENLKDSLSIELEGNTYIAKSIGPNKTKKEYIDFMKENLDNCDNVIFDRFPIIEEYTCGRILRDKNIFEVDNVIPFFKKVDVFIFCYPGLFNILNWGDREQMEGVKENVFHLIDSYNRMAVWLKRLGFAVVEYNYNYNSLLNIYSKIF